MLTKMRRLTVLGTGSNQASREPDSDELDALSDISEDSDLFHVEHIVSAEPRTDEDADIRVCRNVDRQVLIVG